MARNIFNYKPTCPKIDRIATNFLYIISNSYSDQKFVIMKFEEYIEELRSLNMDMRSAAEDQLQDKENQLQDKEAEIEKLKDQIYELENKLNETN